MKAAEWQAAIADGRIRHRWMDLRATGVGPDGVDHAVTLNVSADAIAIDNVRRSAGAFAVQRIADALDALMMTARIYEQRHVACAAMIDPCVSAFIKRGGTTDNTSDAEHDLLIDQRLAALNIACPTTVANCGKLFVLDSKCSSTRAVNHGWIVQRAACKTLRGKISWAGIPVMNPSWLDPNEWMMIQVRGAAHGFGESGNDQDDYSQVALIIKNECELDGKLIDTAVLYTDPTLAYLVTHDGRALPWARHPGVPLALHNDKGRSGHASTPDEQTNRSSYNQRDQIGTTDGPVRAWQRWLMNHGYSLPKYGADGHHGNETESATQLWINDGSPASGRLSDR